MRLRLTLSIVLLIWLAYILHTGAIVFKLTNAVCESYNKSWVVVHNCRLHAINRNKTIMNMNLTFLYPVSNIQVRLQLKKRANGYKPFLYDYTFDACEFMRKHNHPVVNVILNLIKDVSTVNHTCPYEGTQLLKNFYLRTEKMPVILPTGDYLLSLTWMFYRRKQFITDVYFNYVEDW
ncbi:uncharacterized protein Dwil_GK19330 [Drosophila willistoni]|uniref:MD-2-related lipid-recognition domain-containing protein n=2 Tax=Drosophila willistoni TaxID=7260 RepID=B4MP45_DROWI|nr:uncharacterized protein Dwil_GK19330 [Drosophila willistoni]